MKNRKGKMSFRKMFVRAFAAFFAFYLGIMSLFTVVQYKNNQNAHRSRRLEFINSIKQWMPLSTEFSMKEQNLDTSLSYLLIMARDAAGVNETYIRAALYTEEGKEVAKTGSYITCPGANRVNRQQVSNKTSYFGLVDVEKYLSSEQVAKLYAFKQEESKTLKYGLEVSGYLEKDEVIPKVIKIYREEWRPDLSNANPEISYSASLVKRELLETFELPVEGVEDLRLYHFKNCTFLPEKMLVSGLLSSEEEESLMGETAYEKVRDRYNECTPTLTAENMEQAQKNTIPGVFQSTLFKEKAEMTSYITQNGENYYLVVNSVGYPLEVTLRTLIPIYSLSLLVIIILALILSRGLWKNYERQLLLEKQRREFTDTIGHELKTPLGIIRTYSEGLKEKISEEKRDYYLDVIMDETDKMDELILEMLDLSKLEAKAYTLKKEVVILNELIRDVLKNKEKLFTDKRIQVSFEADDEVELVADYKRMHQVINNLVMNALLHTPEHGKVHICVKKGMFSIDNEGEPIKEEELTLVWEAFYKGEKERARCKRGTGLGLSIVRNVLELHNMSYGVRNTQTGVKFWFEFVNRK